MAPVSEPVYHSSSESSQKGEQEADMQQPDKKPPLNCPRCKSTNTKFCYYNNYSRLQPRHFCRACRRHWTAGGTLHDVPFGGGRKYTKRRKCQNSFNASSAATTSTSTSDQSFTDTNNTLPFVEPRFMPAYLPPLEYSIGSIFNEITNTNTEPTFMAPSYDAMNLYNEGPTWQLPDIAPAGYWDEINDLV